MMLITIFTILTLILYYRIKCKDNGHIAVNIVQFDELFTSYFWLDLCIYC